MELAAKVGESNNVPITGKRATKLGRSVVDVVLVHGAWHGAWCWEDVIPLLKDQGLNPIAVDLPTHNPRKSLDDYAKIVANKVNGSQSAVLVGHSRGGDVIPRVVDRASQTKFHEMIFIGSAFHKATVMPLVGEHHQSPPGLNRNPTEFENGIHIFETMRPWYRHKGARTGDITIFKDEMAHEVLYNSASPERAKKAIKSMVESPSQGFQWRSDGEPELKRWPSEVPSTYIRTLHDRAVLPEWQTYRAQLIGALVIDMPTDHTPQISDPQGLAKIITSRVNAHR